MRSVSEKPAYRATMIACYNGYIVQAICVNLAPLLYLTFQKQFGISVGQISSLIAVNFLLHLTVDLFVTRFAERMNIRRAVVIAHLLAVLGLAALAFLPEILPPYTGLLCAYALLGSGGGMIEVMVSPMIEACPSGAKAANMSLLHSFYCWGQAAVVLFSGIWFYLFDIDRCWQRLPLLWAIVPAVGAILFCKVPVYRLPECGENGSGTRQLFRSGNFWLFVLMMICGGAAETTMSQWASEFAESALGLPKSLGDLLGPGAFAAAMGGSRTLCGKCGARIRTEPMMAFCCLLCIASYLLTALAPIPAVALLGCMLCGFSVGIFWPATLSRAAKNLPGGISMFALLALAGDIGCMIGPVAAGEIAHGAGGDLRAAFLSAPVFPAICLVALFITGFGKRRKENAEGSRSRHRDTDAAD